MSQILRPNSDVNTGWSTTSPTRYGAINEVSYNDTNFISTSSIYIVQTCGLSTPTGTPVRGVGTLRWRGKASNTVLTITPAILQGDTVIKQGSAQAQTTSFTTYTLSLTEEEMAEITDWSQLRVKFRSGLMSGVNYYVSWCEFEVPDPAVPAGLEMGMMF